MSVYRYIYTYIFTNICVYLLSRIYYSQHNIERLGRLRGKQNLGVVQIGQGEMIPAKTIVVTFHGLRDC